MTALVLVLLFNWLAGAYLFNYPFSKYPEKNGRQTYFQNVALFQGLKLESSQADNLLLGDSTCRVNLLTGPFADRIGGPSYNLGNTSGSSMLMDAWILSFYIQQHGVPENVIVLRSPSDGYPQEHRTDFLAAVPLEWGYWDRLGVAPEWQKYEKFKLWVNKYLRLYGDADVLSERIFLPWKLPEYIKMIPKTPGEVYFGGDINPQETMDLAKLLPESYFNWRKPVQDTAIALHFMCELARENHFQLYIVRGPEWQEAVNSGWREAAINYMGEYAGQYTDSEYVHFIPDQPLQFPKNEMQNINHLRPGAERVFTECVIENITSSQNRLTATLAVPIEIDSVKFDKAVYAAADIPNIELRLMNSLPAAFSGGVSAILRPIGGSDANWVARSQSVPLIMEGNSRQSVTLKCAVGIIEKDQTYEAVIFVRQDIGNLVHETRFLLPDRIVVY
jgi:hypothetical protein